ncbi:EcsC family protein [Fodinicola acaciae]|uniref:EcsC family protein n=1 Tax=Fodinicola acaciae TaxID=2681555 RepID=UPI0013CF5087|nr:EcsC family protein [Fodinicola acaciae]
MGVLAAKSDNVLVSWLQRAIDAGIDGIGPFRGARDLVDPLRRKGMSAEEISARLVKTQCGHAALQGAVTSVGGLVTAAIGAPVGLAATLLVQARLTAAIAYAHGHDLADLGVRGAIESCVAGTASSEAAKSTGVTAGKKAAGVLLPRVQAKAAQRVATRVAAGKSAGFIASRVASTGASRIIPVVGAVVGGVFDLVSTKRVADRARRLFASTPYGPNVIDGEVVD